MPAVFGDHPGWEHTRELDGQQSFHRTVDLTELVADSADDEAVVEDGLTGDLDWIVRIRRYGHPVAGGVIDEESGGRW